MMILRRRSRKQFHHLLLLTDTAQFEVLESRSPRPQQFIPPLGKVSRFGAVMRSGLDPVIHQFRFAKSHRIAGDYLKGRAKWSHNFLTGLQPLLHLSQTVRPVKQPPPDAIQGRAKWGYNFRVGVISEPHLQKFIIARAPETPPLDSMQGHVTRGHNFRTGLELRLHLSQTVRPTKQPPLDSVRGRAIWGHNFLTGLQPPPPRSRFFTPQQPLPEWFHGRIYVNKFHTGDQPTPIKVAIVLEINRKTEIVLEITRKTEIVLEITRKESIILEI